MIYHATVIAEDGTIHQVRSSSLVAVLTWSRAFLRPQLVSIEHVSIEHDAIVAIARFS